MLLDKRHNSQPSKVTSYQQRYKTEQTCKQLVEYPLLSDQNLKDKKNLFKLYQKCLRQRKQSQPCVQLENSEKENKSFHIQQSQIHPGLKKTSSLEKQIRKYKNISLFQNLDSIKVELGNRQFRPIITKPQNFISQNPPLHHNDLRPKSSLKYKRCSLFNIRKYTLDKGNSVAVQTESVLAIYAQKKDSVDQPRRMKYSLSKIKPIKIEEQSRQVNSEIYKQDYPSTIRGWDATSTQGSPQLYRNHIK